MVSLTTSPIDIQGILKEIASPESGGIDVFIGTTRNNSRGRRVQRLEYEAYGPMALKLMESIEREASERWPIHRIAIVHRIGKVDIGQASVVIAVSSVHRGEAFHACKYLIDRLKEIVPIWKREYFEDGTVEWSQQAHAQGTSVEIQQ